MTKRTTLRLAAGLFVGLPAWAPIEFLPFTCAGTLPVMNCQVSKAWTGRSRLKSSDTSPKKLLDAVAGTSAGMCRQYTFPPKWNRMLIHTSAELPPSHREQSLQRGHLAGDTTVKALKRQLDVTTKNDPARAKRARWTQTDTQQPGEKAEPVDQVCNWSPTQARN